jgi:hypothetical protein
MAVTIGADLKPLLQGFTWNIRGFVNTEGRIYPVPEIPQVITGLFEALVMERIVEPLVNKYRCRVVLGRPRDYPQLTLFNGQIAEGRIAIDIKTARRQTPTRSSRMSLGSCAGYFRNPTRKMAGCLFPYGEYKEHLIVGFVYTWNPGKSSVELVSDVEVIIQEKWRVASRQTATGDTAAMGSVTDLARLREGRGDFASEEEFEAYWRSKPVRRQA